MYPVPPVEAIGKGRRESLAVPIPAVSVIAGPMTADAFLY